MPLESIIPVYFANPWIKEMQMSKISPYNKNPDAGTTKKLVTRKRFGNWWK